MKTALLRITALAAVLLVTAAACAQGPGRHAVGRPAAATSPAGLGYGAGYHARRMQQAEREDQRARQATTRSEGECTPLTPPRSEPEPARANDPGQNLAPARRDACVATKP